METSNTPAGAGLKLLDQVRGKLLLKRHSLSTELAYVDWVKRFILFHGGADRGMSNRINGKAWAFLGNSQVLFYFSD